MKKKEDIPTVELHEHSDGVGGHYIYIANDCPVCNENGKGELIRAFYDQWEN